MAIINVDFNIIAGEIKAMHATGQPPLKGGFMKLDFSHIQYLKDANIPYSRLHDVGGPYGANRYVDIPNIFRDFDADVNDPASYDFAFTDALIEGLYSYGIEPIYRLGVTIENQAHIKAYRIHPPKDYKKWAQICEHIVRHYNEGWADGFTYGIKYWEIWNEPENNVKPLNQMWTGTDEQFYELYDVTAKHLKECFGDSIKVGGYGASGCYGIFYHPERYGLNEPAREKDERYDNDMHRIEFLYGFMDYIKEHNSPIDFFSWHSYANSMKTYKIGLFIERVLEQYGYGDIELQLNEWNNSHTREEKGTSLASAKAGSMMCLLQKTKTNILCHYQASLGISPYNSVFSPMDLQPFCIYYTFKAWGELYELRNRVATASDDENLFVIGAVMDDKKGLLVINDSEETRIVESGIKDELDAYLIDENHLMEKVDIDIKKFQLKPYQVMFFKN